MVNCSNATTTKGYTLRNHKIHVGQRVMDSDGIEGVVLSIEESSFSKAVARVQYRSGAVKPERFVYVDALVPAPADKPKPEPVAKPGDRVRDIHGKEGVVFQTGFTGLRDVAPSVSVASVRYDDGAERSSVRTDSLTVLPKEGVKSGDRVRHTEKVDSVHRRTNGTVVGMPVSNGLAIGVLWEGGVLRTELLSQLEVTHPAKTEDVPHKEQEIIDLIEAECEEVRGQIAAGHVRLRALVAAKRTLMEIR